MKILHWRGALQGLEDARLCEGMAPGKYMGTHRRQRRALNGSITCGLRESVASGAMPRFGTGTVYLRIEPSYSQMVMSMFYSNPRYAHSVNALQTCTMSAASKRQRRNLTPVKFSVIGNVTCRSIPGLGLCFYLSALAEVPQWDTLTDVLKSMVAWAHGPHDDACVQDPYFWDQLDEMKLASNRVLDAVRRQASRLDEEKELSSGLWGGEPIWICFVLPATFRMLTFWSR